VKSLIGRTAVRLSALEPSASAVLKAVKLRDIGFDVQQRYLVQNVDAADSDDVFLNGFNLYIG